MLYSNPQLKFDAHIKKLSKTVKTSLNCFRLIRSCLSLKASHLYVHAMVLSHLSYCITAWGQATDSATRPLFSLHKQALKILDQKPQQWHHCKIIEKYNLLTISNFINLSFLKVVFKCKNGANFLKRQTTTKTMTRSITKQNCKVWRCRTTFGQSSFSVQGMHQWNSLPSEIKSQTELKTFSVKVKLWLKQQQKCEHNTFITAAVFICAHSLYYPPPLYNCIYCIQNILF